MAYKDPIDPANIEAARESRRKHYRENREQYYARNKAKEVMIRDMILRFKDRPCMDCGVQHPYYVMDLDHRDPLMKSYPPTRLPKVGSLAKAEAELAKCDVVCANCHRERTHGPTKRDGTIGA